MLVVPTKLEILYLLDFLTAVSENTDDDFSIEVDDVREMIEGWKTLIDKAEKNEQTNNKNL